MSVSLGVHLGGVDIDVAEASGGDPRLARSLPSDSTHPPAAILSFGAPLRVHRRGPVPLDGAGLSWPESARPTDIAVRPESGRIPIPHLWKRFLQSDSDISSRTPSDRAEDALAALVEDVLVGIDGLDRGVSVVIPNELDEGQQQRLLDACRRRGTKVSLLWRPVAAAFAWLEAHADSLPSDVDSERSLGWILSVHAGLDGCEASWLELIARPDSLPWILPARGRPRGAGTLRVDPPLDHLVDALHRSLAGQGPDAAAERWRALWASPTLLRAFAGRDDLPKLERFGLAESLPGQLIGALEADVYSSAGWIGVSGASQSHQIVDWASSVNMERPDSGPLVGAIATGEFASLSYGGRRLGDELARMIAREQLPRILCEGSQELSRGVLARGAALYRARRAGRRPTYLDSLPELRILIEQRARPVWISLLDGEKRYVAGGETWRRDTDLGGLSIKANEQRFTLSLAVEGEESTRRAAFELPEPPKERAGVALRAEMEPAGGRARVQLVPLVEGALGRREVRLDWDRALPTGKDTEQTIDEYPLKCPVIQPRRAWKGAWGEISRAHEMYRRDEDIGNVRNAYNLAPSGSVNAAAAAQGIAMLRPIGSDGRLHDAHSVHQAELESFNAALAREQVERVQGGREPDKSVLAALGYAATEGDDVDCLVQHVLQSDPERVQADHSYFLAGCVRHPHQSAAFVGLLQWRMAAGWVGYAQLMKSVGYHLQWRENALDETPSVLLDSLVFQARQLIAALVSPALVEGPGPAERPRSFGQTERNALVLIAFVLRKRADDTAFLTPASVEAQDVKKVLQFAEWITSSERPFAERVPVMGGMVNVPKLIQQVIQYIDERGTGTISAD